MTGIVGVRRFAPRGGEPPAATDEALAALVALARKPLEFADGGGVPASARYRLAEECGTCEYYEDPDFCLMFDAEVEPEMVCDEWKPEAIDSAP